MKANKNKTGRKCDYCPSKDASPLTLKNLTVVSSCEPCYETGAFKQPITKEAAKPTHTPGPWKRDIYERGLVTAQFPDGRLKEVVANVGSEEDALLIAAAPDLLKSTKALLLSLRSYCATHNPNSIGACCLNREDAAAAIAKAEGR